MNRADFRTRRLALQLTQVELAQLLGLSSQTISNIETERFPMENPTMLDLALSYIELQYARKSSAKPSITKRQASPSNQPKKQPPAQRRAAKS